MGMKDMQSDLQNDNKMCEIKYTEQSVYKTENDYYKTLVNKLLISNRLQISELSRTLRIQNPNYYVYALKSCQNENRMIEDLTLLCNDIDSLESNSIQRKRLLERLDSFINPLRYFNNDENLMLFSEKIRNEYFA